MEWRWWVVIPLAIIVAFLVIKSVRSNFTELASIPKIIHQTAPADETKWNPIWKSCQESWKKNFSNWEYRMWTDEDLDEFIKTKHSWFYPTYTGYLKNINRIDAARYFILYDYGGIYADMDFECLKNFEHLLPEGKACAAESPWNGGREKYQNALMASPVKHPFWESVWKDLEENKNHTDVLLATGPEVIHRVADANPEIFHAFPKTQFAPSYDEEFKALGYVNKNSHMDQLTQKASEDVYTRHHGTGSWF